MKGRGGSKPWHAGPTGNPAGGYREGALMLPSKTKVMVMAALLGLGGGAMADAREDAIRTSGQTIGGTAPADAMPGHLDARPPMVETRFWTIGGAGPFAGAIAACRTHGMAPVRVEKADLRAGTYQTYLVRCGAIALSGHHVQGNGAQ